MAYGTNQGLTDYAADTGRTLAGDPDVARRVASQYLDGLYWDRYRGKPVDQYGDAWPRTGISGIAGVPVRVEQATYEAALLYDADPSALSAGGTSNIGSGVVASEKVDVIAVSYHAPQSSDNMTGDTVLDNTPRYDVIEGLLRPFLRPSWSSGVSVFVV